MTESGRRGPYAKTADRRRQILRAARDSFVEHGVDGASLRDIAARAGMTHAGLLHHFASKDELLVAVLRQRDLDEEQETAHATADGATAVIGRLLRQHQTEPDVMRFWAELTTSATRPDHPAHGYVAGRYEQARTFMEAHFRRLAAEGALAEGADPRLLSALLAAVLDGLQTQWLLDRDLPIEAMLDQFLRLAAGTAPPAG